MRFNWKIVFLKNMKYQKNKYKINYKQNNIKNLN